jgi:hypothetical protein
MANDDDKARLLAALSLSLISESAKASRNRSFDERLADLELNMVSQGWQITVARDLEVNLSAWIGQPWNCWKLSKLLQELQGEALDPVREANAMDQLNRCAAMLEYGVDVNPAWYRRLRLAAAKGLIESRELRSLLGRSTVWWGTSTRHSAIKTSRFTWAKRLWSMGRPASGELLIAQHHWVTRLLLTVLLLLSGTALTISLAGFAFNLTMYGSVDMLGPATAAVCTYSTVFWAAWWFGPHSWLAVQRLRKLFPARDN